MIKIKRKTPVFSSIVLRVLKARFMQVTKVNAVSDNLFELILVPGIGIVKFTSDFDRYMAQVIAEFGDPDQQYTFKLILKNQISVELRYCD